MTVLSISAPNWEDKERVGVRASHTPDVVASQLHLASTRISRFHGRLVRRSASRIVRLKHALRRVGWRLLVLSCREYSQ